VTYRNCVKHVGRNRPFPDGHEHEERTEEKDKHYLRRERHYGFFRRSMALPPGVDPAKIEATTRDGVVEVTIPLPKEAKKETIKITSTAT